MAVPKPDDGGILTGQRYLNQATNGGKVLYCFADFQSHYGSGAYRHCLEDEGVAAGVCAKEDSEGLKLISNVFLSN